MAHRSKKKHLKHVHQHEPATPPAKSPVAKAEAAAAGIAKRARTKRRAPELKATTAKKRNGLVRRLAGTAGKLADKLPSPSRLAGKVTDKLPSPRKLAARPRKAFARAKSRVTSRVKSLLGAAA